MRALRKVVAIGVMNSHRFVSDRINLFSAFVFPVALIIIIGVQFGASSELRVGLINGDGKIAQAMLKELAQDDSPIEIVSLNNDGSARARVGSGDLNGAISFPPKLDTQIENSPATKVKIYLATTEAGQQLNNLISDSLARAIAVPTAERAAVARGATIQAAADSASQQLDILDRISVHTVTTGDRLFPADLGGYDIAAPSMLVLFIFVNVLAGSAALIETRQLGMSSRMMSTPTSLRTIIFGEALGRLFIGLGQGIYILVATLLVFGVHWGDIFGAGLVILAISAAAAGAAMCFGAFFSNAEQASGIGIVVALSFAALGGAMLPIELFSPTLTAVARFTPHYWAIDAFSQLVRHDGGIGDIWVQLVILFGFAAVFLLVAAWRMRAVLTRP